MKKLIIILAVIVAYSCNNHEPKDGVAPPQDTTQPQTNPADTLITKQ